MTHRGWGYRFSLVLLTLVTLIPQAYFVYIFTMPIYLWGFGSLQGLYPLIPGLTGNNTAYSEFSHAQMWRGKFVHIRPNTALIISRNLQWQIVNDYLLTINDPVTDEQMGDAIPLKQGHYRPVVLDDRLFLFGGANSPTIATESYEYVDGRLEPVDFVWPTYDPMVLLDGELGRIQFPPAVPKPIITRVQSGAWTAPEEIVLPSFATLDLSQQIAWNVSETGYVQCINDGPIIHSFLRSDKKLYYRVGLTVLTSNEPRETKTYGVNSSQKTDNQDPDVLWQPVKDKSKEIPTCDFSLVGVVDGLPVALLVDGVSPHDPVGHFYRFDGEEWTEESKIQFPLGSNSFRLLSTGKGIPPYIVATTSTGTGFAYQLTTDGIHEGSGQGPALTWNVVKRNLVSHLGNYSQLLGVGLLPCLAIAFAIRFFTRPEYSFGLTTVKLASIGRRALARFIDLLLIGGLTTGMGWILLQNVNWFEVAESWNLGLPHSDILKLYQAIVIEIVVIASASILLILMQGLWGVTPGKWLCGLRTLRTTLRPCGIARSLVRELLLAIDSTYLFWWVPGCLSIGLTDNRQRLGDLIGDTIVVVARSLKPRDLES